MSVKRGRYRSRRVRGTMIIRRGGRSPVVRRRFVIGGRRGSGRAATITIVRRWRAMVVRARGTRQELRGRWRSVRREGTPIPQVRRDGSVGREVGWERSIHVVPATNMEWSAQVQDFLHGYNICNSKMFYFRTATTVEP